MKFHAFHFNWLSCDEFACLTGFVAARVDYSPEAKWLYSFRVFLLLFKVEILWTAGVPAQELE